MAHHSISTHGCYPPPIGMMKDTVSPAWTQEDTLTVSSDNLLPEEFGRQPEHNIQTHIA